MIKILLGGSPCTKWSIARCSGRETKAEGIGWELFYNYVVALKKFRPDLFLFENNWSVKKEIKDQIQNELAAPLMRINSNLVSAQNRDRFYVFNWSVDQPEDRNIALKDVVLDASEVEEKYWYNIPFTMTGKENGVIAKIDKPSWLDIMRRVYSINGKSPTLNTVGAGNQQAKILQNGKARKLTPLEYERLQTLPENYTEGVSNTQRYKQTGNCWTAEIIIHILSGALKNVSKDEKIIVLSMYDGIGTGRYCFDKMGFKNIEYHAYEIDKYAIKTAMKNYPDIIQHGNAFSIMEDLVWQRL